MIKVENLVKAFGAKLAVNDVSFTVERGEVLGFLGPNGAGKSTTMRMITGFIPPTSGGSPSAATTWWRTRSPAKRLIGYLPENAPGYADMTRARLPQFLRRAARPAGRCAQAGGRTARSSCASSRTCCTRRIDTLSKGYKHRTCLAQSLIHDPGGPDPGRADRRPRSQPEARSAQPDQAHGREEGDHLLHPHPRGSRGGLLARDHHRPRPHRRQRHAGGTEGALAGRAARGRVPRDHAAGHREGGG